MVHIVVYVMGNIIRYVNGDPSGAVPGYGNLKAIN